MTPDTRTYTDDDYCSETNAKKTLAVTVAGGDYYLTTSLDDRRREVFREGPLVRIRTSGSADPRNARVCLALRELWEALADG